MNKKNSNLTWKTFSENINAANGANISSILNNSNEILILVHCLVSGYYRRFSKTFSIGFDIVESSDAKQYFPLGGYYSSDNYYFCGIVFDPATNIINCDALRYAGTNFLNSANMWIFYR